MDGNGGGLVLFDEFCVWCAHKHLGEGFTGAADEAAVDRSAHYQVPDPSPPSAAGSSSRSTLPGSTPRHNPLAANEACLNEAASPGKLAVHIAEAPARQSSSSAVVVDRLMQWERRRAERLAGRREAQNAAIRRAACTQVGCCQCG